MPASSRRDFLRTVSALSAGLYLGGSPSRAAESSSNEKLNIALIGPGGQGGFSLANIGSENVVAFADVDEVRAKGAYEAYPKATRYKDFRKLLDKENLDAVVVCTTDHTHAHASIRAMRKGLHCYCEKPLTHTVAEARLMAKTAAEHKLATQMGTQIHAGDNYRRVVEIIQSGAIGQIRDVHVWVGSLWGGGDRPAESSPIPPTLDWDLWLGPAPERPFHEGIYVPANWRRWWDFGNSTLGDMGCHYIDLVFWCLDLRHPTTIAAEGAPPHPETGPLGLKATWEFPARGDKPPVKVTWTDGDLVENTFDGHKLAGAGVYFIGDKGTMFADYGSWKLFPEEKFKDYQPPKATIPRSIGHHAEWIKACKTGGPTTCNFDYAGALTETVLLGTVAYRTGKKLEWDAKNLTITNSSEANGLLQRQYRKGWDL
jgi:predicted dehydrogenase